MDIEHEAMLADASPAKDGPEWPSTWVDRAAPAPVWPAMLRAAKSSRLQFRGAIIAAVSALVAGAVAGPWSVGWNLASASAAVMSGSWLLFRHTRSYIAFKCFFLCHWDYRGIRSTARKMTTGNRQPDPAKLKVLWDGGHERCAQRGYECVAQLQGLWVKLAQMMATRSDILPEVYCRLLGKAQDQMPARPIEEIKAMVAAELGSRDLADVFDEITTAPIGCASIAQVHRARLAADGTEVVLKLQHHDIEQRMAHDLIIFEQILGWIKWLEPEFDLSAIARQWVSAIPEELDFQHEATNMAEMLAGLESTASECTAWASVEAVIPRVYTELSTRSMLVQAFEPGAPLSDVVGVEAQLRESGQAGSNGDGKFKLLQSIARWYGRSLFFDGLFHADPHPGNFLLSTRLNRLGGPLPVLLDFGLVKRLPTPVQLGLARLVLGSHYLLVALSPGGPGRGPEHAQAAKKTVLEGFSELGFAIASEDTGTMMDVALWLFRPSQTAAEAEAERVAKEKKAMAKVMRTRNDSDLKKVGRTAEEERQAKLTLKPLTALPEELILFQRVLTLFRGLCTKHSVKLNMISELAPFAEHALREAGTFPAALEPAVKPAVKLPSPDEMQLVPGTNWALVFDDDGEMEYLDTRTGKIVGKMPPEVAAAEKAMMQGA